MKIGVIGAGLIGKTLAKKFSDSGHTVSLADAKGVNEIRQIANNAGAKAVDVEDVSTDIDVLILAIPLLRIPELAQTLKSKLDDSVVVVETTNYWPHRDGRINAIENGMVNSVWVQQQLGRTVVKAFSNIGAYSLLAEGKPKNSDGRIAVAVSGDVQKEIDVVMGLVDDVGFDALDSGPLEDSWRQQACGPAYCTDLSLNELKDARESAIRETLVDKQTLSFETMKDLGQEFFDILVSGQYPEGFVDHAVDINRSINGLPPRVNGNKL
ncbi:3-hydroxyisobutyrate dehydrogenase [Chryseobacterium aquaticum]|uniref:3-hydroxyisobutyrate dehydrogenase n=1 Tax=Chryseobacterium aquaticum TaxID=452084 RepID=A0A0Q3HTP8_9FLAO|nr:NAD(P)-binding domain-containing protein [Chryseobacterium aquaticum]KQK26176.1 3-hydroxyisobutyrate dehydrogenase [Chryseobacterium aquaticum]